MTRETLDKIEQTVAIISAPVAAVIGLWTGFDAAVYTEATAGLIITVCEYIKLFIKK